MIKNLKKSDISIKKFKVFKKWKVITIKNENYVVPLENDTEEN